MKYFYLISLLLSSSRLLAHGDSVNVSTDEQNAAITLAHFAPASVFSQKPMYDIRRRNILKINATSLIFRNVSLQYERSIIPRISVAVGFRYMTEGKIPLQRFAKDIAKAHDVTNLDAIKLLENARTEGWAFTPELKIFLGKGNGSGFYLAPFYRYESYNVTTNHLYLNNEDVIDKADFTGKYTSSGVGVQIGWQILLANRLHIDWWIIGPYYANQSGNLNANYTAMSASSQNILKTGLNALNTESSLYRYTLTPNVGANNASATFKGTSYLARMMGVTLGIKF